MGNISKTKRVTKKKSRPKGRPPVWASPGELWQDIEGYLSYCKEHNLFIHKTGFAAFVGCSKQSVYVYLAEKGSDFSDAINYLLTFGEESAVQELWKTEKPVYGKCLIMKNAYQYRDTVEDTKAVNAKDVAQEMHSIATQLKNSVGGSSSDGSE